MCLLTVLSESVGVAFEERLLYILLLTKGRQLLHEKRNYVLYTILYHYSSVPNNMGS